MSKKYTGQYIVLDPDKVEVQRESDAYYKLLGAGWLMWNTTKNGNKIMIRPKSTLPLSRVLIG